jgi:hypothetical protein
MRPDLTRRACVLAAATAALPSITLAKSEGGERAGAVNSVETIVSDMRLKNDLPLAGAPKGPGWTTGPGHVVMGNDPRGTRTPSWWVPANGRFKSDAYWNVVFPWFVIFDGVGHEGTNTRVQIRGMKVWIKGRRSGDWRLAGASDRVDGAHYAKHLQGGDIGKPDVRIEPDGSSAIRPPGGPATYHGWCCGPASIDGPDVAAVFVTLQARLVVDRRDRPDDRSTSRYLVQVGADYYPDAKTQVAAFAPVAFNPGVGLSRFKLVTTQWQAFNFATIDVGVHDPGGASITVAEFRRAPPPLD